MTVTLIGSRAMKKWFPDAREPKDWDWQSPTPILNWDELFTTADARHDLFVDERLAGWKWSEVATPHELYTMKISHGYWDINGTWDKHASDTVFLQRKGALFIPELHDILKSIWTDLYKKNPISLDKTAGEFFNDHVVKKFVHDTVHESVAYHERPWYESYLKDGSEVLVDNAKFWGLPLEAKLEAVREELYVIALERKLIPGDYTTSPMGAYRWALRRTATSLFKGEWAKFLLLNLDELARPDVDFVRRHKDNAHKLVLAKPGQLVEDE
jgi:hypothetical protein